MFLKRLMIEKKENISESDTDDEIVFGENGQPDICSVMSKLNPKNDKET